MFPYAFVYSGTTVWLVWYSCSDDEDRFLTSDDSLQLLFAFSKESLKAKLIDVEGNINWEDYSKFDFDIFWRRIANMRVRFASSPKTCEILLDGFNFLYDVVRSVNSVNSAEVPQISTSIYDKFFAGCNLPSLTPENKMYCPVWSKEEIHEIKEVAKELWRYSELERYVVLRENDRGNKTGSE